MVWKHLIVIVKDNLIVFEPERTCCILTIVRIISQRTIFRASFTKSNQCDSQSSKSFFKKSVFRNFKQIYSILQHECQTRATRVRRERHECYTSNTRTTRVRHE